MQVETDTLPVSCQINQEFNLHRITGKFRLCSSPASRTRDIEEPNDLQILTLQPAFQPPLEVLVSATSNPLSTPILLLQETVINKLANAQPGINLPYFILHFQNNLQFPTLLQKAATRQGHTAGCPEERMH